MNDFRHHFSTGRAIEDAIKAHLKKKGWLIIPTADIVRADGKGPRAEGERETLVLPDFDVVAPREGRFWAEVKAKSGADFTILTRRLEHGIGLFYFRQYLAIAARTHAPVLLFIYELNTGLLLHQDCARLASQARYYTGEKMDAGGMVFFPRDAFVIDDEIPEPPRSVASHIMPSFAQDNLWKKRR